jgi:hypothetical protein
MAERDYPVGHPSASDYKGEHYVPPRAPFSEDFPPGHPARDGKNIGVLDTPDGKRAQTMRESQDNAQRTAESEPERHADVQQASSANISDSETTITITGEVHTTPLER